MALTSDGGLLTAGNLGFGVGWVVRSTSVIGPPLWQKLFGGKQLLLLSGFTITPDGSYLAVGLTLKSDSTIDGWIMRMQSDGTPSYTNPSTGLYLGLDTFFTGVETSLGLFNADTLVTSSATSATAVTSTGTVTGTAAAVTHLYP
jgi:hypothetical protein